MEISLSKIFTTITLFCLTFMVIEFLYSIKKRDGVYSKSGTLGNFLDYLVTRIISDLSSKIFLATTITVASVYLKNNYNNDFNLLIFITCLLIIDFEFYLLHFLKHKINFLWMFHHVHHSDNKFNTSTFLRASWVEQALIMSLPIIPPMLIGINPETILLSSFFGFIFQFFVHSQYIKFPHFMSYIFITPQLHKIHHDQVNKNQNSNFGAIFSMWDRMFGTYVDKIDNFTPGIKGYHQENILKIYTDPIINNYKK